MDVRTNPKNQPRGIVRFDNSAERFWFSHLSPVLSREYWRGMLSLADIAGSSKRWPQEREYSYSHLGHVLGKLAAGPLGNPEDRLVQAAMHDTISAHFQERASELANPAISS